MKRYGELRQVAAIPLLLESLSTCLLPIKAGEANPTLAGDRNQGRIAADAAAPARTDRGADPGEETRVTKTVTVPNPEVDRELETKAVVVKIPLLNVLTAEGAMEAGLHKRHPRVAFATDGKSTVSAPDTIRKSANSSTLAAPLLPSL